MIKENKTHYLGHRRRMREKVLNDKITSFEDYELVEFLLFMLLPRRDVKPLAKKLLENFNDISELINASKDKIMLIEGVTENVYTGLVLVREFVDRVLKSKIRDNNIVSCWSELLDYLKSTMSNLKVEQFRVLFLNAKNVLIADEVIATGTINQATIYPREIIQRVLFHNATSIIFIHNHPSGCTKPSKADIELTERLKMICGQLNISIHDHVIIAGHQYYSFKSNMLM